MAFRLKDDKPISESELFADRYKILDKDIDFGYAITSHKSQGSTYPKVFVNHTDMNIIQDSYNRKYRLNERRNNERLQIKYVAITRASKLLYLN